MADSVLTVVVVGSDDDPAQSVEDRIKRQVDNPRMGIVELANYLNTIASGMRAGKVLMHLDQGDGTAASQTVTCSQSGSSDGDTLTLCGVTLTVASSPSSDPADGELSAGSTDTEFGDNLVEAIEAHPKLKHLVSASNSSGTVTVTMKDKHQLGNVGTLSETGSGFTVGGANFASGAAGTVQVELRAYPAGVA